MSNDSFLDLVDDQLVLSVSLQRVGADQFAVAVAGAGQGSVGVGSRSCPGPHGVNGSNTRSVGRGWSSTGSVKSRLGCHELIELAFSEGRHSIGIGWKVKSHTSRNDGRIKRFVLERNKERREGSK